MLCFQVVLWSTLFKYHLELGHYKEAYEAMMANPDPIRYILLASVQSQNHGYSHPIHVVHTNTNLHMHM